MKILLILILSIVIIISSCTQSPEGYVIKGKLENGNGKTIQLNELNTTSIEPIDSVKINEDGTFVFEGITSNPMFLLVQLGSNNFITIITDSLDKIEIAGDANNIAATYTVKGSKDSELLRKLNLQQSIVLMKIDSISTIFNQNKENPAIDSIKMELDKTYAIIMNKHRNFVISFINENPESLASIMALYQQIRRSQVLNTQTDYEYFQKVDEALSKKYPKSKHARALHANLIEVGKAIEAEKVKPQNVAIGSDAPEISLANPDGTILSLSDLRGKYVLLDFWAGWCRPCRMESPTLLANYKKYHDKGFEIFQVSLDKNRDEWVKAIEKDGLIWNHVSDLKYWSSVPAKIYNVSSIPASFLIDKEGKIIAKDLRGAALGQKLAKIFK